MPLININYGYNFIFDNISYQIKRFDMAKKNQSIATQISEREVRIIDKLVDNGYYCSRSDAIRAFIRCGLALAEKDNVRIK